ncbi:hypothetical protein HY212_05245 [Candidatus Pacearchaeota archaeon]|nr:hypothetical protein [Candidatus Pacearchaeota archaeon]
MDTDKKADEVKKGLEKPHFAKVIDYAPEEYWRTDILIGQKESESHGHLALSGAKAWYFRDEKGNEIIKDGKIVKEGV